MFRIVTFSIGLVVIAGACAGCGGGGGSDSVAPSVPAAATPTSFNLAAARQSWNTSGLRAHFQVSGNDLEGTSVSGNADYDASPTSPATVNGQSAIAQTTTVTGTVNGAPYATSGIEYSNLNDETLIESSDTFDVAQSPIVWPAIISVGDTGTLGTFSSYYDDTMSFLLDTKRVSYVVKANSADSTTAIFALIENWSSATGTYTEEDDYLITESGAGSTINRLSIQNTFSGGTANLILQAN